MARSRLKVSLKGFDEMLEKIQDAGGDVDRAARVCVAKSVRVLESNLIAEANASGAETTTVSHSITSEGNRVAAETGWKLGEYDSKNPSEGYRAMFTEFGTGKYSDRSTGKDRQTTAGADRGSTEPHPFMDKARRKSAKQIRAIQKDTLHNILEGLEE